MSRLIRFVLGILLSLSLTTGCGGGGEGEVIRVYATIVADSGGYLLVADTTGHRYRPDRIPLSYREDGLKVMALGHIGEGAITESGDSSYSIQLTSLVARTEE